MKRIIFVFSLLLIAGSLSAQKKSIQEIKETFWGADDPYKNSVEIPDKWKNESAVIIYQEFYYYYKGSSKRVTFNQSTRKRIKLLDKAAVEEYSEFEFAESFRVTKGFSGKGGKVFAGVKVIKPDGTENEIDMEDAVEVKSDTRETLKKLAVPDLQPGDIIDYYFYIYEPFIAVQEYMFDPIITTLNASYPIMKQKIHFDVARNFFINFRSVQGAPELKETVNESKKFTSYTLIDEDRDKSDDIRWFYSRRVLPAIKFQVVYARKARLEKSAEAFLGEKEQVKKKVTKEEVLDYYKGRIRVSNSTVDRELKKYLSLNGFMVPSKKEARVREAYYYLRHYHLINNLEPMLFYQEGIYQGLNYYGLKDFLEDESFVGRFGRFLSSQKIPFDIVVTVPRFLSNLDDLLLKDEISLLIRVNFDEPLYFSLFSLHTIAGTIPYSLEGADAYVMDSKWKSIKKIKLPVSTHIENTSKTITKVKLDPEDFNKMSLEKNTAHHRHNRLSYQDNLLVYSDFLYDEYRHFENKTYLEKLSLKRKVREKVEQKLEAKLKEIDEGQKERFENDEKSDMDFLEVKKYNSYKIQYAGRTDEHPAFVYDETLEVEGLIKKAGKNYIFEVGKFIGGQVALKEDEMERKQDIYMTYPRSFENEIIVEIPEGYTVAGLENFQKNIENATGGFISTAKVEGNQLIVTANKFYKNNYEPAANWSMMVEFLEAAFDFTQQKVLLKKK